MQKKPPIRFVSEDPVVIATNRLIITIGCRRYTLDIAIRCTELRLPPAEVIPIDGPITKGKRKIHSVTEPIKNAD